MPSPRFKFALEPLLRARLLQEQLHQRAVAEIERERLKIEDTLRRHQAHLSESKQSIRENLVGRIHPGALRMHASASLGVMRAAQRIVLELAGVHRRLDVARTQLVESARQRRAVEILRERRYQVWQEEVAKAEAGVLDELVVIAAARPDSAQHSLRSSDQL
jgi:flagellar protein FliJ